MSNAIPQKPAKRRFSFWEEAFRFLLIFGVVVISMHATRLILQWHLAVSEEGQTLRTFLLDDFISIDQLSKSIEDLPVNENVDYLRGFIAGMKKVAEKPSPMAVAMIAAREEASARENGVWGIFVFVAMGFLIAVVFYRTYHLRKARDRIAELEQAAIASGPPVGCQ